MKLIALLSVSLLSIATSFANEIKITSWYRLDPSSVQNRGAEVCFKLSEKPTDLINFRATVDLDTKNQATYYGQIGPEGATCKVVSTFYGKVRIELVQNSLVAAEATRFMAPKN